MFGIYWDRHRVSKRTADLRGMRFKYPENYWHNRNLRASFGEQPALRFVGCRTSISRINPYLCYIIPFHVVLHLIRDIQAPISTNRPKYSKPEFKHFPMTKFTSWGCLPFSSRTRFFVVWCQRSIWLWVCGWNGTPQTVKRRALYW